MRIELPTRAAAHALADYLRRCECSVVIVDERWLEALPPSRAQNERDAQIEIEAYLLVWRAMYADDQEGFDEAAARVLDP